MGISAGGHAKDAMFDPETHLLVGMLLEDHSLACLSIPAVLGTEIAALLRAAGVQQVAAGQVADLLEQSVLGDLCLLNVSNGQAVELLLGDIAETALPGSARAAQLAAVIGAKLSNES